MKSVLASSHRSHDERKKEACQSGFNHSRDAKIESNKIMISIVYSRIFCIFNSELHKCQKRIKQSDSIKK